MSEQEKVFLVCPVCGADLSETGDDLFVCPNDCFRQEVQMFQIDDLRIA